MYKQDGRGGGFVFSYVLLQYSSTFVFPTIGAYKKIASLTKNSLLVFGNFDDSGDGDKYSRLLQCEKAMQKFIDDLVTKLSDWGLKGIEISYIWPGAPQVQSSIFVVSANVIPFNQRLCIV